MPEKDSRKSARQDTRFWDKIGSQQLYSRPFSGLSVKGEAQISRKADCMLTCFFYGFDSRS